MEYIRNNLAARTTDLRLYLDYNPDHAKFNAVRRILTLTCGNRN